MRNDTDQAPRHPINWYNALNREERLNMLLKMAKVATQLKMELSSEEIKLPASMRKYYIDMLSRVINTDQIADVPDEIDDDKLKRVAKYNVKNDTFIGSTMQMVKFISIFYKKRRVASKQPKNIVKIY